MKKLRRKQLVTGPMFEFRPPLTTTLSMMVLNFLTCRTLINGSMMKIVELNPIKTMSLKRLASGLIIFWGPYTKSLDFLTTQCVYPHML